MSPSDASNAVKPLRPARLPAYNAASASACSVSIAHSDLVKFEIPEGQLTDRPGSTGGVRVIPPLPHSDPVKFASPILTLQPSKSVCTLPAAEALHRLVHFIGRSMRKNDGEFISPTR